MKVLVKLKDTKIFVFQENEEKPMHDFDIAEAALKTMKGEETKLLHVLSEYAGETIETNQVYSVEIIQ